MVKLWHHKKGKLNNKGMSLVEVLVAMIILSVAGVAFLQSFNYASANNRKAKEKQHALVLAQSMMETVKAYGIEKMDEDAETILGTYTRGAYGGTILPTETNPTHTYKLNKVDFNNAEYNVVIEATPATESIAIGDVAEIHNPTARDMEWIRDIEEEQEKVMEGIWQAICDTESAGNTDIDDYLASGYSSAVFFDKELIDVDSRIQNIILDYADPNYSVTVSATYKGSVKEFDYIDNFGNDMHFSGVSFEVKVLEETREVSELESLYFYYCPVYERLAGGFRTVVDNDWLMADKDWICFYNYLPMGSIDYYIVKQKLPGVDQTYASQYEDKYSVTIDNFAFGSCTCNLYHNLNKHSYTQEDVVYTPVAFAEGSGSEDKKSLYEIKKDNSLLYDVTVNVYRKSDNSLVFSLDGSVNEK